MTGKAQASLLESSRFPQEIIKFRSWSSKLGKPGNRWNEWSSWAKTRNLQGQIFWFKAKTWVAE